MRCVVVDGQPSAFEQDNVRHIEAPSCMNTYLTLCGWVDVPHHLVDGSPNCPVCLGIVKYCYKLNKAISKKPTFLTTRRDKE